MKSKFNPGTNIKCFFSNQVHKLLEPNIAVKKSERWKHKEKYKLSNEDKIKLFDEILLLHQTVSEEYLNFLEKRNFKKKVQKLRESKKVIV